MQFFKLLAAASTLTLISATVELTNTVFAGIAVNKPFVITWKDATEPVTLKLKTGPSTNQVFFSTIASNLTGTSYSWTPSSTIPDATYNLEIDSGSDVNYSQQFEITGGTGTTSSASSASGSTTGSSSTTSSSGSTTSSASVTTSTSSHSSTSGSSSSSGSSTTSSTASVPTSNSAIQNGSPFALVIMGALAIAGLN